MTILDPASVEAVVSWCAVLGVLSLLRMLWTQPARTPLERRLMFLLECFAVLLIVRGIYWMTHGETLDDVVSVVASIVPLALLLYAEGMIRRHYPLAAKLFVLVGGLGFFVLAAIGRLDDDHRLLAAFAVFILLAQLVIVWGLVFRDRGDLTDAENRMVNATAVAIFALGPMFLTDVLVGLGFHLVRLGALGVLMFVYASVRFSEPRGSARATTLSLLGAVLTGMAMTVAVLGLLEDRSPITLARAAEFFTAVTVLFMIGSRMRVLRARTRERALAQTLASADTRSLDSFSRALARLPMLAGHRWVREADLADYDRAKLLAPLHEARGEVTSLARLRRRTRRDDGADPAPGEQLADLIERHAMTHACLVTESPCVLLLVHVPQAGQAPTAMAELALVRRMASLVAAGETHG